MCRGPLSGSAGAVAWRVRRFFRDEFKLLFKVVSFAWSAHRDRVLPRRNLHAAFGVGWMKFRSKEAIQALKQQVQQQMQARAQ